MLPLGRALFSDDADNIEGLDKAVPHLPNCLVVLTAAAARGAVLVAGGAVVDAVWVDDAAWLVGVDAARAVFGAREGNVAAHSVDDPRLVAATPMLWRAPRLCAAVPGRSVNVESFVAGVRAAGSSCALLVAESADPGVALFNEGALVGGVHRQQAGAGQHQGRVRSVAARARCAGHAPGCGRHRRQGPRDRRHHLPADGARS